MTETSSDRTYDVVVVGGGPAGLSGALALGRARRSVLVIDGGQPRNTRAEHVHNYLGREGTPPGELLAIGRAEVAQYGVHVEPARANTIGRDGQGFRVDLADGRRVRARRLLVTTGLHDELPDLPGLAEAWGHTVLHCPYCHGWEVRDRAIGILGTTPFGTHQAQLFRQLSADVTYFQHTAPALTADEREQLDARGIAVVEGRVAGWGDGGVRLATGELVPRDVLVVAPFFAGRSELLEPLGLVPEPVEMAGYRLGTQIAADTSGRTTAPGVWVAGNIADVRAQVISSAAAGLLAGAAINADLILEETAAAVELARHVGAARFTA